MSLTPTLPPKANIVAGASVNESQAFDDGVNASFWFFKNQKSNEYWSFLCIFCLHFGIIIESSRSQWAKKVERISGCHQYNPYTLNKIQQYNSAEY